ncbi:MAG: hypothetical protein L6R40_002575 [Gallowayella cf. fulva]|nr:MAG: hypothetical protein L6R40_002575 [Xanthomendoza cf. fulva]
MATSNKNFNVDRWFDEFDDELDAKLGLGGYNQAASTAQPTQQRSNKPLQRVRNSLAAEDQDEEARFPLASATRAWVAINDPVNPTAGTHSSSSLKRARDPLAAGDDTEEDRDAKRVRRTMTPTSYSLGRRLTNKGAKPKTPSVSSESSRSSQGAGANTNGPQISPSLAPRVRPEARLFAAHAMERLEDLHGEEAQGFPVSQATRSSGSKRNRGTVEDEEEYAPPAKRAKPTAYPSSTIALRRPRVATANPGTSNAQQDLGKVKDSTGTNSAARIATAPTRVVDAREDSVVQRVGLSSSIHHSETDSQPAPEILTHVLPHQMATQSQPQPEIKKKRGGKGAIKKRTKKNPAGSIQSRATDHAPFIKKTKSKKETREIPLWLGIILATPTTTRSRKHKTLVELDAHGEVVRVEPRRSQRTVRPTSPVRPNYLQAVVIPIKNSSGAGR